MTAMYQREDGIVEFDGNVCIGCKACMQACPYDAIHIDPSTNTSAKCHFCAHRIERGMEPACVIVCPQHAIVAGDVDDPESEINRVLATNSVSVRKPEQGTAPKLFYIDAHDASLTPTATSHVPHDYIWSEAISAQHSNGHASANGNGKENRKKATSGATVRPSETQGHPKGGPIHVGDRKGSHLMQVAYNVHHEIPWHWPVPAYLVTKGVAAGLFLFLAVVHAFGFASVTGVTAVAGFFTSLLFTLATSVLLVLDLSKPERFLRIMFRPQQKSWLARGAFILSVFSTLSALWWAAETVSYFGWLQNFAISESLRNTVLIASIPFALGAAIYTAFLFGQAEGRDLWQSSLLPVHLTAQAVMAGTGALLTVGLFAALPAEITQLAKMSFLASLVLDLFITLFGEFGMPHQSEVAGQAAHKITRGEFKNHFWFGSITLGHIIPILLILTGQPFGMAVAGVAALIGLYFFEYAFVKAPQKVANS